MLNFLPTLIIFILLLNENKAITKKIDNMQSEITIIKRQIEKGERND